MNIKYSLKHANKNEPFDIFDDMGLEFVFDTK